MNDNTKWDTQSEDMEDEDYIMEEEDEQEEMRINSNSEDKGDNLKAVYPEGFGRSTDVSSPRFSYQSGFTRYDMNSAPSPVHGWHEAIDEKGDSVAVLMQLEKSIVHQKFFNDFADDFDEDDLA